MGDSSDESENIWKQLQDHNAKLSGGLTVLQNAVYEHNMLAASKLYKNIAIEQLSKLLGVSNVPAEDLARIMIQESRMSATIDQVDGIIEFESDSDDESDSEEGETEVQRNANTNNNNNIISVIL